MKKEKTLKAVKKTGATKKRNVKKPRTIEFSKEEHKTHDFPSNVMYKPYERIVRKNYFSEEVYENYESTFRINKGRAIYKVQYIYFYDKSGVKYKLYSFYEIHANQIHLLDVDTIKLKKEPDFTSELPHMVSKGKYSFQKYTECDVYLPMRYLEEIGYEVKEETKENKEQNFTDYYTYLVTPHFKHQIGESRRVVDFEAQKAALLKKLKTAKTQKDVARIFDDLTLLRIPNHFITEKGSF